MKFTKLLVAAGIALSALGAQAQNLVKNGSFEDTVTLGTAGQNNGSWTIYPTIPGWTGNPDIEVRDNHTGVAQDGSNFVELDAYSNSAMYQDIVGFGYADLTFYYSARPNTGATNDLRVTFGSLSATVLNGVANNTGVHNWIKFTANGVKLDYSGVTRLTFYAEGANDSLGGSLDNVSVTAVPEVETYAMMLAGLGLMGTIVRRRKIKAA